MVARPHVSRSACLEARDDAADDFAALHRVERVVHVVEGLLDVAAEDALQHLDREQARVPLRDAPEVLGPALLVLGFLALTSPIEASASWLSTSRCRSESRITWRS